MAIQGKYPYKGFVKRNSERIKLLRKIKFGIDQTVFPGKTYNLSEGGMLIHSFKAFIPGTLLNLNVFIENTVINLDAEVKWVRKAKDSSGSFMGLKVVGNSSELRKVYKKEQEIQRRSTVNH